jgi:hypothetical protein
MELCASCSRNSFPAYLQCPRYVDLCSGCQQKHWLPSVSPGGEFVFTSKCQLCGSFFRDTELTASSLDNRVCAGCVFHYREMLIEIGTHKAAQKTIDKRRSLWSYSVCEERNDSENLLQRAYSRSKPLFKIWDQEKAHMLKRVQRLLDHFLIDPLVWMVLQYFAGGDVRCTEERFAHELRSR